MPSEPLAWCIVGANARYGRSPLNDLPKAQSYELYLPPNRVLRHSLPVPPSNHKQLHKLLPFALDNYLLNDTHTQHIAYQRVDNICYIAICEKHYLQQLTQIYQALFPKIKAIYSLVDLLPATGNHLLWYEQGWLWCYHEQYLWFDASSVEDCPAYLSEQLQQSTQPLTMLVNTNTAIAIDQLPWQKQLKQPLTLSQAPWSMPLRQHAVNLLTRQFPRPYSRLPYYHWIRNCPSIKLIAIATILYVAIEATEWLQQRSQARSAAQANTLGRLADK